MGSAKIPYYIVIKGRGYWNPTRKMKALGFSIVDAARTAPKPEKSPSSGMNVGRRCGAATPPLPLPILEQFLEGKNTADPLTAARLLAELGRFCAT